ncbi:hypothetical protein BDA96_03G386800 [Sorghum bicolor]|uniref:Uncharacterized protein n=1 Tax=Sorghum bicolor TaxID=4558 RepID=A0A921RIA4_SORBI|nr:hypothetical protein BDA96_03G386800 [Sorghum bicolor]
MLEIYFGFGCQWEGDDAEPVAGAKVVDDEVHQSMACFRRTSLWPDMLPLTSSTVTRSSGARSDASAGPTQRGPWRAPGPRSCPARVSRDGRVARSAS